MEAVSLISSGIAVRLSIPLYEDRWRGTNSILIPERSISGSPLAAFAGRTSWSVNNSWFIAKQLFLTLLISCSIRSMTSNVLRPHPSFNGKSRENSEQSLSTEHSRISRLTSLTSPPKKDSTEPSQRLQVVDSDYKGKEFLI